MASGQKPAAGIEVIVTWQSDSGQLRGRSSSGRINLKTGEELKFGISERSGKIQPNATPSLGWLKVSAQQPTVSNITMSTTYVVENLEGGAELIKVRPRQLELVIPFEMSRILVPTSTGVTGLTVYAPPPRLLQMDLATRAMISSIHLDKTSKYFLVLVVLCEPRLRESSMTAVPSLREVVERLRGIDQFKDANRSSVNYHIDYLALRKLPVGQWSKSEDDGLKHSKREALVAFALRFDLVSEEDLRLLPPSSASRRAS
ncbi:FHA domain-containing protein [Streptomyces calidiresistens]